MIEVIPTDKIEANFCDYCDNGDLILSRKITYKFFVFKFYKWKCCVCDPTIHVEMHNKIYKKHKNYFDYIESEIKRKGSATFNIGRKV